MAVAAFGSIETFDVNDGEFDEYVERLQQYFVANDITGDNKKVAVFVTVMGKDTYTILRNLLSPVKPNEKTFEDIVNVLRGHFKPTPLVIAERYKFYERKQTDGENVNAFIAELKKLSLHCEFGDFLDQALRDKLVCGIGNSKIRKRLLVEKDLTFSKASQIANAIECAENESSHMTAADVKKESDLFNVSRMEKKCYRCDDKTHLADRCRHINSKCYKCTGVGHIGRACKAGKKKEIKKANNIQNEKRSSGDDDVIDDVEDVRHIMVENITENMEDAFYHVHVVSSKRDDPYVVQLYIENRPVTFEIDTGAGVTLISEDTYKSTFLDIALKKCSMKIKTYTNEVVNVLGEIDVTINRVPGSKPLKLIVVKGGGVNLLGRNWLNQVRIDWKSVIQRSVNKVTVDKSISSKLKTVLEKYASIFENRIGKIKGYKAKLHVKGDAVPKFTKARNVPFALQDAVDVELDRLVMEGVLKPVPFSEWASPIVIVPKADSTVRICGDFKRTLNPYIENEVYPTPSNEEIFAKVQGGQKFSKIDLRQAYLQLELDDDAKKYVVINTSKGLMEFQRMANGIKPASGRFQNVMESILRGIPMVGIRTDDVLISGRNDDDHLKNLESVFKSLYEAGITVKKEKCRFFMEEVENLGHIIDKNGIRVNPKKTDAISKISSPQNIKQLQSFIGAVNYYGKYIPDMAHICIPLYELLRKDKKWEWGKEQEEAFIMLKKELLNSQLLANYDRNLPIIVDCDASKYAVGAVISHVYPNGDERPISFASRTLNKNERNYSQVDKEGAAVIFAVDRFQQYIFGRKFTIRCDNKAICRIFGKKSCIPVLAASRLIRWSLILNMYDFDIKFRPTDKHNNADMLSRIPLPSSTPEPVMHRVHSMQIENFCVDAATVRQESVKDPQLSKVISSLQNDDWSSNEIDRAFLRRKDELYLEQGIVMWGLRVVVPETMKKIILKELHDQHPGIVRMKALARIHVWYPGIDQDIQNMVQSCCDCKKVENNPPKIKNHPWKPALNPMDRIHLDYFGPFSGKMYLVLVDSYSKWCEVETVSKADTKSTIEVCRKFFCQYGLPNQVVSDNGTQFTSAEFKEFCKQNGIVHTYSAPYHQSSNGQAERFVQTIKKGLKMNGAEDGKSMKKLNNFLFAYRITPNSVTGITPSELFLGRLIKSRLDNLKPNFTLLQNTFMSRSHKENEKVTKSVEDDEHVSICRSKSSIINEDEEVKRKFEIGENVYIRNYVSKKKWIPGIIEQKTGSVTYVVNVNGELHRRHVDQIIRNHCEIEYDSECDSDIYMDFDLLQPPVINNEDNSGNDVVEERPNFPRPRRYPQRERRPVDRYGYS